MSASFSSSLNAARDAAAGQDYPQGTLYVVATPIGNLADITLRALHLLQIADVIACEDTRHTGAMLRAYGIDKAGHQLLALHQHNEAEASNDVISRLKSGNRIAYVSDAGTPAVSDPGARLVSAVRDAGIRVMPLPGASSVVTLMSAAGVTEGQKEGQGFLFHGFLPSKTAEREAEIESLRNAKQAIVLMEAPHRIDALAKSLALLGNRKLTVGRELTKQFEEIDTVKADGFTAWLDANSQRARGEFVVVVHPAELEVKENADGELQRILYLLLPELPLKSAVKLACEITGEAKNRVYDLALQLKNDQK